MEGILTEGKEDCITTEKLYYAQFFFDEGYGFNNPSLQVGVDLIKKINIFNIEFPEDKVLKSIKLIPLNSYVIISIKKFILFTPNESIEVTNNLITNALFKRGDIYFFTEEVPHILYDKKDTLGIVKKIEAIIEYLYFSEQALKETIYTLYRSNIGIDNGKINKEEIYSLHNILLEKDEEICKLKKMLVKAKEIIVSLQAFTTCKDNLEKEILMYITSKSWRYTRTIRKFFKIIKKIRDKEINLKKIIFLPKIFHKFKELKNYWRLKKSNLFDIGYYLSTYSEIRAEDIDPLWHFIKKGCKEDKIIAPWLKNVTLSLPPHISQNIKNIHPLLFFLAKNDKKIYKNLNNIEKIQRLKENFFYNFCWIGKKEPQEKELEKQRNTVFKKMPLISIILYLDLYDQKTKYTIDSILCQTYNNWELLILSSRYNIDIKNKLVKDVSLRSKIKFFTLRRKNIFSDVLTEIVKASKGEYITFIKNKDMFAPFALFEVVKAINKDDNIDFIYYDEDIISSKDNTLRYNPFFKPEWSPDTLRSFNYIRNLLVIEKSLLERIDYFKRNEEFQGVVEYDLVLRATEQAKKIVHIDKILYHTRDINIPYLSSKSRKKTIAEIRVLSQYLQRKGIEGKVKKGLFHSSYKIEYKIKDNPLVSIVIPNKDNKDLLKRCIISLLKSSYSNIEIIIVENFSKEKETFLLYEELKNKDERIRIIEWKAPSFNYSLINNYAVEFAKGKIILFLNNDTEMINSDAIERMVENILRKEIGIIGAKLYYPDNTIQHGGVIFFPTGLPVHVYLKLPRDSFGEWGRLKIIQNYSAVTAACLMIRKEVFKEVGGFDEKFQLAFGDIDFCLKVRNKGYLILWTPFAEFYHYESKTRGYEDTPEKLERFIGEAKLLQNRWRMVKDPYFRMISFLY